jgi:hypothetical protein
MGKLNTLDLSLHDTLKAKPDMPSPSEHLAASLEVLQSLQERGNWPCAPGPAPGPPGTAHPTGFLGSHEGWYIPTRPDDAPGDSTALVRGVLVVRRPVPGAGSARRGA